MKEMISISDISKSLTHLKNRFTECFGDDLWMALKAGIGVTCSLALKDRSHPVVLIYEGASGRGKSSIIYAFEPDREETRRVLYRLDSFTSKAFVSHVASVPREHMEEIDLLPKVVDKVLLVKELAPVFRGNENELRDRFSNLTSVLDGKGYKTASGVHGTRGYEGSYIFNWLGGTTPIPAKTDAVMAQLGNRLLRYEIAGKEFSEDELVAIMLDFSRHGQESECRTLLNSYLQKFFEMHPVSSVSPETIELSKELAMYLVRCAKLTAAGRVEVTWQESLDHPGDSGRFVVGVPEGPIRLLYLFRQIAQGLALAEGRRKIIWGDTFIIRHIAISSIPSARRRVLKAVAGNGGCIDSAHLEKILGVSRPTARRDMNELAATGIVALKKGSGNEADEVELGKDWEWLKLPEARCVDAAHHSDSVAAQNSEAEYVM